MTIFERLGIPGPRPNLIFGNAIDIAKKGTNKVFPLWTKKYGSIVGFYIGGHPQILVSDMELIRLVFVKDFQLFSRHEVLPGGLFPQSILQHSIAWAKGKQLKQLRSTLTPSFSPSKLHGMEPLMMTSIENMIRQIDVIAKSGHELNFLPFAEEVAFSVGAHCLMGVDPSQNLTNVTKSLKKSVRVRLEKSMLAMLMLLFPSITFIVYPWRVWWETIRLKNMWSNEGVVVDFLKKILSTRKDTKTKAIDMLQLLMDCEKAPGTTFSGEVTDIASSSATIGKAKERLSEDSIISNSFITFLAAFETSASTLQFAFSDLVNNQDVQDELRLELRKQVVLNDGVADLQAISKVPLLLNSIKETLRIHPPVAPSTTRFADEDYEYNGLRIAKGMGIFVDVMSIHNDPHLWPEPEKYKPERFATEFNKLAYLPFGAGPRNCIGMQFAFIELQLALAKLILRYKFVPGPSTEKDLQTIESTAVLAPKNGVYCKILNNDTGYLVFDTESIEESKFLL